MSDNYLTEIIVFLLFYLTFMSQCVRCEPSVTAKCGRPPLPPKAQNWLVSAERDRFDNKEKVIIVCKRDEFPSFKQELECNNGRWKGRPPRCGQHMDAQVIHLDISNCETNNRTLLVSQPLNQTLDGPPEYGPLHPNSFHGLRVPEHHKTYANGYNCYTFSVRFDRKVQIWFLLVDIWIKSNDTNIGLDLSPFVNNFRTCVEYKMVRHSVSMDTVFGFYFVCDLKNESDISIEETHLLDTITFDVKTNSTQELGLEAVFIGDIFKTIRSKIVEPDCGQIQIETLGVDVIENIEGVYVSCNETFIDLNQKGFTRISANGNPIHKFTCNWNGVWVGNWPICVPKRTCPQIDIFDRNSSVEINQIGNVYYLTESQWYAIDYSYVRYSCVNENDIMIGKSVRTCLSGDYKWSGSPPTCRISTQVNDLEDTTFSCGKILGILFVVEFVLVLMVLYIFRMHSKRLQDKLSETRNELMVFKRRKVSYISYDDNDNCDDPDYIYKSMAYEMVDYQEIRDVYQDPLEENSTRSPAEYLVISPNE